MIFSFLRRKHWLKPTFLRGLFCATLILGACVTRQGSRPPLDAGKMAGEFSSRSLADEGLRQFLVQNASIDPATWPKTEWTFEELNWAAFYFHPSLDLARAQWAAAQAAYRTAKERPNPSINLVPGFSSNPPAGVSPWIPSVNLDFLFENASKRNSRAEAQKLAAEAARLSVLTAAWKVRSDLRRAYLDAALNERRLENLVAQQEWAQQLVDSTDQRFKAGVASAFELSTARLALIRAQTATGDARRLIPSVRSHLAQAMGVSFGALEGIKLNVFKLNPAKSFSPEDLAALNRVSLQTRADLLEGLAVYNAAELALEVEIAKRVPDLHVAPGYQWDQGQNKWTLGFSFEIPLFHRINVGPVAEAKARLDQAAAQFNLTQSQVIGSIEDAAAAYASIKTQVKQSRDLREELQKRTDLAEKRRAEGGMEKSEFIAMQIENLSGELALIDIEGAALVANGQLEDALQVPFDHFNVVMQNPHEVAEAKRP